MDRLVVIVDALNDVFQITLLHREYMVPVVELRHDNFVIFVEACNTALTKYREMKLEDGGISRWFINSLESVDKIK